jgi:hypothetical protein
MFLCPRLDIGLPQFAEKQLQVHAETLQDLEMILCVLYVQGFGHVDDTGCAQMQYAGTANCTAHVAAVVEKRKKRGDLLQHFGSVAVLHDFFPRNVVPPPLRDESTVVHHPAFAGGIRSAKQIKGTRVAADAGAKCWKIDGAVEAPWMLRVIDEGLEVVDRNITVQGKLAALGASLLRASCRIGDAKSETACHALTECQSKFRGHALSPIGTHSTLYGV